MWASVEHAVQASLQEALAVVSGNDDGAERPREVTRVVGTGRVWVDHSFGLSGWAANADHEIFPQTTC